MLIEGRKVLLKAIVGSHNYNLNSKDSDTDYKVFVIPTFEDLYKEVKISASMKVDGDDLSIHDIRMLPELLYKSNINFTEVLFSSGLTTYGFSEKLLKDILSIREDIAKANLPYLYNACVGMYISRMKGLLKSTPETKESIERYGYDRKSAHQAYRSLDFLERYCNDEFKSFKDAIYYKDEERDLFLQFKNGAYSLDKIKDMLDKKFQHVEINYKETYSEKTKDVETLKKIEAIVIKIVKENIDLV